LLRDWFWALWLSSSGPSGREIDVVGGGRVVELLFVAGSAQENSAVGALVVGNRVGAEVAR
jgi:hypothetical protein